MTFQYQISVYAALIYVLRATYLTLRVKKFNGKGKTFYYNAISKGDNFFFNLKNKNLSIIAQVSRMKKTANSALLLLPKPRSSFSWFHYYYYFFFLFVVSVVFSKKKGFAGLDASVWTTDFQESRLCCLYYSEYLQNNEKERPFFPLVYCDKIRDGNVKVDFFFFWRNATTSFDNDLTQTHLQ